MKIAQREVWMSYDCPNGADADLFDEQLVWRGKAFHCHWCGGEHVAGMDIQVHAYVCDMYENGEAVTTYPDLPGSEEELMTLLAGAGQ